MSDDNIREQPAAGAGAGKGDEFVYVGDLLAKRQHKTYDETTTYYNNP